MTAGQDLKRAQFVTVCLIPDANGKRLVMPAPCGDSKWPANTIGFTTTQDWKQGQDVLDLYLGADVRGKIRATSDIVLPRMTEEDVIDAMMRIRRGDGSFPQSY